MPIASQISTTALALLLPALLSSPASALGARSSSGPGPLASAGVDGSLAPPLQTERPTERADEKASQQENPLFSKLKIEKATEQAKEQKKLLVMVWSVEGDPDGERLLRTLSDPELVKWLQSIAVCTSFDPKVKSALAVKYAVVSNPCITLLDPAEEREIDRLDRFSQTGDFEPSKLRLAIEGVLAGSKGEQALPTGEKAEDPHAWMGWGNYCFKDSERSDEALYAYLWCLDNADEAGPAFLDEYFEFLIYRCRQLSTHHARAKTALQERRNDLGRLLKSGEATLRDANFFARYNFWLRQEKESIELVESSVDAPAEFQPLRRLIFQQVLERCAAERRYELIVQTAGDMVGEIRTRMAAYEAQRKALLEAEREDEASDLIRDVRAAIIRDGADYFEALAGVGRGKDARDLMAVLAANEPNARIYALLVLRCKRLDLGELANDIGQIGIAAQGDNRRAKQTIERALNRKLQQGFKDKADRALHGGEDDDDADDDGTDGDGR